MGFNADEIARQVFAGQAIREFVAKHALTFVDDKGYELLASQLAKVAAMKMHRNRRAELVIDQPCKVSFYPCHGEKYKYDHAPADVVCKDPIDLSFDRGFTVTRDTLEGERVYIVRSTATTLHVVGTHSSGWRVKDYSRSSSEPSSGRRAGYRRMGRGPDTSISR